MSIEEFKETAITNQTEFNQLVIRCGMIVANFASKLKSATLTGCLLTAGAAILGLVFTGRLLPAVYLISALLFGPLLGLILWMPFGLVLQPLINSKRRSLLFKTYTGGFIELLLQTALVLAWYFIALHHLAYRLELNFGALAVCSALCATVIPWHAIMAISNKGQPSTDLRDSQLVLFTLALGITSAQVWLAGRPSAATLLTGAITMTAAFIGQFLVLAARATLSMAVMHTLRPPAK